MPRSRGTVEESSPSAGQLSPRLRLRSPRLDEASKLTELCLRSKACWGYGEEFMRACEVELTVTASTMCPPSYFKLAEIDGRIVGMAQVILEQDVAKLEKLFVEPSLLRSGAGKALFDWAASMAREAGAGRMVVEADPNAAGFYQRMGAVDDGVAPSGSIPGRILPRLTLRL